MLTIDGISGAGRSVPQVSNTENAKKVSLPEQAEKLGSKEEKINIQAIKKLAEDKDEVENIAKSMSKLSDSFNNKLKFELDDRSASGFVVRVVDRVSGDVVKEFPPEEFLEMVSKMHDFLGAMFDKRV